MFWLIIKKNKFLVHTLNQRPGFCNENNNISLLRERKKIAYLILLRRAILREKSLAIYFGDSQF